MTFLFPMDKSVNSSLMATQLTSEDGQGETVKTLDSETVREQCCQHGAKQNIIDAVMFVNSYQFII